VQQYLTAVPNVPSKYVIGPMIVRVLPDGRPVPGKISLLTYLYQHQDVKLYTEELYSLYPLFNIIEMQINKPEVGEVNNYEYVS
jgi:hypothetical protein